MFYLQIHKLIFLKKTHRPLGEGQARHPPAARRSRPSAWPGKLWLSPPVWDLGGSAEMEDEGPRRTTHSPTTWEGICIAHPSPNPLPLSHFLDPPPSRRTVWKFFARGLKAIWWQLPGYKKARATLPDQTESTSSPASCFPQQPTQKTSKQNTEPKPPPLMPSKSWYTAYERGGSIWPPAAEGLGWNSIRKKNPIEASTFHAWHMEKWRSKTFSHFPTIQGLQPMTVNCNRLQTKSFFMCHLWNSLPQDAALAPGWEGF